MSKEDTKALRLRLLSNGYTPIPNVGKTTYLKGWPTVDVTADVVDSWSRKHSRWQDTGIRVQDGLAVIDFDIDHREMMDEIARHVEEAKPALSRALIRYGKGFKEAWFVRTGETFGRIHTRRWLAPGADLDKDGTHVVEIFGGASPRQFGAFGAHTREPDGSVKIAYEWATAPWLMDDGGASYKATSPLDVPLDRLPEFTKQDFFDIVDIAERLLEAAGWTYVVKTQKGETTALKVWDLTEDMVFETNQGEVDVAFADLRARAVAGEEDLRVSASFIEPGRGHSLTRCIVRRTRTGDIAIWDSATDVSHRAADKKPEDTVRPAELAELGRKLMEKLAETQTSENKAKRMSTLREGDDANTAANKLLASYGFCPYQPNQVVPLYAESLNDGMTLANFRNLVAPWSEPIIGARGGVLQKRLSPADIWVNNKERRVTLGGLQMRPDRGRPTFEEAGKTWVNVYKQPVYGAAPEGMEVFLDFMEHLVPDPEERAYTLDALAHKLRYPAVPGPGLLMVSPRQGAGRGTLFSMLRQLYGPKYARRVDPVTLTGEGGQAQYNTWMASATVVLIDELFNAGDGAVYWRRKKAYDRIKALIDPASREVEIIQKTLNNVTAQTYTSFIMATNNPNALPLDEDDRRVCVLMNGGKLDENPDLKARLMAYRIGGDFSEGFIAGVATVLAARSLEGFDAFAPPPMFAGKISMIHRNTTDAAEAADAALEEIPGDFITRNAFIERVKLKLSENGIDAMTTKHLVEEARERIDRSGWFFMGRVKVNERQNKADVWARSEAHARHWSGVSWSEREALIGVSADPRKRATEAFQQRVARGLTVIEGSAGSAGSAKGQ
jgi:hypothetical protein